ncbi:MAG TPA: SepM family pheromone-processing serine protease [Chondromyces sp.]|nr:SepM family pheromone-processing serine protease [Chondromyces sp.]
MLKRKSAASIVFLLLVAVSFFYTLPFYVSKPGSAHELKPIVKVEGGEQDEGEFMLTTVRMGPANIYTYLLAQVREYEEVLPIEDVRSPHETDEEYNERQAYLMENSKQNAVTVAFDHAKKPYHFNYRGVYVLNVFPDMPAEGVLKPGDRITAVDNRKLESSEQFTSYIQKKQPGSEVNITFMREDKQLEKRLTLKRFQEGENKVGIGISLVDDRELVSKPKVILKTEEIGGPSAGLMFSLEIYNQLVEEDITGGRSVAGTGTISPDGSVGRIGGIEQKIVAADRDGAEIFFAPSEEIPDELKEKYPDMESNYEDAVKTAEDIESDMKIVPVKTFDDALSYLEKLNN